MTWQKQIKGVDNRRRRLLNQCVLPRRERTSAVDVLESVRLDDMLTVVHGSDSLPIPGP